MNYDKLFEPIKIGHLTLKNRFVMAPMSVHMTEDGSVSEEEIAYTERRAQGGAAMLIIGSLCIRADGNFGGQVFIDSDARIPDLRRLTEAVHRHDCLISAQIHHAGRETNKKTSGYQPVAPSYFEPETCLDGISEYDAPRVLSTEEVGEYVEAYAQAVYRAAKAGFDMCELHCAHGYLICSFMSPLTNTRTDKYGGSFHNRMRFVTEIFHRSHELVGTDFPITCRIVGDELCEGGINMALAVRIARYLEGLGAAALSVSAGMFPYVRTVPNMYHKHGINLYLAENIRDFVQIPVMAAGQLDRPQIQLDAISRGKADIICLGRALIADPDYPDKLRQGREDDIIYCIACNKGCHDRSAQERHVACALNPLAGRERNSEFAILPAQSPKRVMIIGGGPAGLEAARVAALRGHKVTLHEKGGRLGGRLRLAAVPPHKARYGEACDYLEKAVRKLGVTVHLNSEVSIERVRREKAEFVVLASGSRPFVPPVQGIDGPMVVHADAVLDGSAIVGTCVAVIGGGSVGAETAHYLMEQQSRRIHILEMRDGIGLDLPQDSRICLLQEFAQSSNLHVHVRAKVTEIKGHGLTFETDGVPAHLEGLDSVVLAVGARPEQGLKEGLEAEGIPHCLVGDADRPGDYVKAIREGFLATRTL